MEIRAEKTRAPKGNRRGVTLIETMVAVAILGIIAIPLLTAFLGSTTNAQLSGKISKATYLAQSLIEQRTSNNYTTLLASQVTTRTANGGVYYTLTCAPTGPHDDLYSGSTPCYMHMIYNGTSVLIVGPDGKYTSTTTGNFNLTVTTSGYTFKQGSTPLISGSKSGSLIVIINAYKKTDSVFTMTISGTAKSVLYLRSDDSNTYSITPAPAKTLKGIDSYSKSMVKVRVEAYDSASGGLQLCTSEDTLTPANP